MSRMRARSRMWCVLTAVGGVALVAAASASAHARVSPAVAKASELQMFSLAVPTEKENARTVKIVFTPPSGFSIDSFVPSPGWKRSLQTTGSGENAVVQKVTWNGGSIPTGEDAFFEFLAEPAKAKTYTFGVQQTYSDGEVVDWSGPESSDAPSPTIEAVASLGGGSGSSTLSIVALGVAAVALVLAIVVLLTRSGGRSLT